ncbi:MAG TPA: hypothetical protein VF733_00965 [Candidatus Saccharimonadales bacterium]
MATHFTLKIDEKRFEKIGVEPQFDENRYDELIDAELQHPIPDDKRLTVVLSPRSAFRSVSPLVNKFRRIVSGSTLGYYDMAGKISIGAEPDVESTNFTLRHETKHWLDDIHNIHADGNGCKDLVKPIRTSLFYGSVALGTSYCVKSVTGSLGWGLVAGMGYASLDVLRWGKFLRNRYDNFPWEIEADEFAEDKARIQRFGQIITYSQLGSWERYALNSIRP